MKRFLKLINDNPDPYMPDVYEALGNLNEEMLGRLSEKKMQHDTFVLYRGGDQLFINMLDMGLPPNGKFKNGDDFLSLFIYHDSAKVCTRLLKNCQLNKEQLHRAMVSVCRAEVENMAPVLKKLIKLGGDPADLDESGSPILFSAIQAENKKLMTVLFENGAKMTLNDLAQLLKDETLHDKDGVCEICMKYIARSEKEDFTNTSSPVSKSIKRRL